MRKFAVMAFLLEMIVSSASSELCFAQNYFKQDRRKVFKIIHSDSEVEKVSHGSSSVHGDVVFEFGNKRFTCDSAVYYKKGNRVFAYHMVSVPEELSKLAQTPWSRDLFVFNLSDTTVGISGP